MIERVFSNGLASTIQSAIAVVEDWVFDNWYRLDTRVEVAVQDLDISQEDKQHAEKYKATRARYFRKLMKRLQLTPDGVFVDVGCGKGRILLLAAEHGFGRVVGLEISPNLSEIAQRNIAAYKQNAQSTASISVVCTNILHHQFKHEETVFFLYSPFEREVTQQFLEMVRESIRQNPRSVFLVIDELRFPELLENDNLFEHAFTYRYGAAVFNVYQHQVA